MKLFVRAGSVCLLLAAGLRADTVLVLPFFNTTSDASLNWIGESVAETIRDGLSGQGVMALDREERQEAFRRLGVRPYAVLTRGTILKLGQSLDAEKVIYGDFEAAAPPAGKRSLRITAHILDLRGLKQGAEMTEMGALDDLAAHQRRVAWRVLDALNPRSAPAEAEFAGAAGSIRLDAVESYTRGLLASSADQKIRLFNQALRLQPEYSQARYQLGIALFERKDYRGAADALAKVAATDPKQRQATFYLGLSRYYLGDFAGAETAFQQVAATVPLNEVWNNLAAAQSRRNEYDALENFQKALEGDSSDPDYQFNVGLALWKKGRFNEAADHFRAVLDRNPQDQEATNLLGRCLRAVPWRAGALGDASERVKTNYEESAWRQLKAVLEPAKQ
jgi:tetratricopeptide (TPR) repeat protein